MKLTAHFNAGYFVNVPDKGLQKPASAPLADPPALVRPDATWADHGVFVSLFGALRFVPWSQIREITGWETEDSEPARE